MTSMPTAAEMEQERSAYDRARAALKGLKRTVKQDKTYAAWTDICTEIATAQHEVFRITGSNSNMGRVYAETFSRVLKREGLDDNDWLNKPTRSACIEVATYKAQIDEWRATLSPARRAEMNHPRTVLKNWKASFAPTRKPPLELHDVEDEDRGNGDLAGLGRAPRKEKPSATEETNTVLREELHQAQLTIAGMREEIVRLQGVVEDLQRKLGLVG
jgi:hypothetical protein